MKFNKLFSFAFFLPCLLSSIVKGQYKVVNIQDKELHKAHGHYKPHKIWGDTNSITLNYDSADAETWGQNYVSGITQLMNMHYTYPADSSSVNYPVVNYFAVAFDSLFNPYDSIGYSSNSIGSVMVDTIVIPILQVNHSGINDTLDVALNWVDGNGYPSSLVLKDTKITGKILGTNDSGVSYRVVKVPENYRVSISRFAITVKYYGAKEDSCWFIYGFGSFTGECNGNVYTLAEPTNFSRVGDSTGYFMANSFVGYSKYNGKLFPDKNGVNLYYSCPGDTTFIQSEDGLPYFQNIDVYAQVTTFPVGIGEVQKPNIVLSQNYPNPFTKTTEIAYVLSGNADVQFDIYDVTGRQVCSNSYKGLSGGQHTITVESTQFTSGMYFYTIESEGNMVTGKMIVIQ